MAWQGNQLDQNCTAPIDLILASNKQEGEMDAQLHLSKQLTHACTAVCCQQQRET